MKTLPHWIAVCVVIVVVCMLPMRRPTNANATGPVSVAPTHTPWNSADNRTGIASPADTLERMQHSAPVAHGVLTPIDASPGTLTVRLVDGSGSAIEGCGARLVMLGEEVGPRRAQGGRVSWQVATGVELALELGGHPWVAQAFDVAALVPGEQRDLGTRVMTPAASIVGTVLGRDGNPHPGARVSVLHFDTGLSHRRRSDPTLRTPRDSMRLTQSDGRGHYRIDGLPAGAWEISASVSPASPDDAADLHARSFATLRTTETLRIDLALEPRADARERPTRRRGRVLDADGHAVARARVEALTEAGLVRSFTQSSARGEFEIALARDVRSLRASAAAGLGARDATELPAGPIEICLERGPRLTVIAAGALGERLMNADVRFRRLSGDGPEDAPHLALRTGADGSAHVWGLDPGLWQVRVEAPYRTPRAREFQWTGAQDDEQRFDLSDAGCLRVRISDARGTFLPNVPLNVCIEGERPPGQHALSTDSSGWAVWSKLPEGRYEVLHDPQSELSRRGALRTPVPAMALASVAVEAGHTLHAELRLEEQPVLRVRVVRVGPDGILRPAARVQVGLCPADESTDFLWQQLSQRCARPTDATGAVALVAPRPGSYRLFAAPRADAPCSTSTVELQRGVEEIEVRLHTGSVAGRVERPGGSALAGAEVRLVVDAPVAVARFAAAVKDADGNRTFVHYEEGGAHLFADLDGRFLVENVAPGSYHIEVSARGFAPLTSAPFDVGRVAYDLGALTPTLLCDVHVAIRGFDPSTANANYLARAKLHVENDTRLELSANGTFSFAAVPPGAYYLEVLCADKEYSGEVRVPVSPETRIVIDLDG